MADKKTDLVKPNPDDCVEVTQTKDGVIVCVGKDCEKAVGVSFATKPNGSVFVMVRIGKDGKEATDIQPFGGDPGNCT